MLGSLVLLTVALLFVLVIEEIFMFLLLFLSSMAFAQNGYWFPAGKLSSESPVYWDKSVCESEQGVECVDTKSCPLDECSFVAKEKRLFGLLPSSVSLVRDNAKVAAKLQAERSLADKKTDLKNKLDSCASGTEK